MTRDEIIRANPLMQFLTSYGYELRPAGKNFVTNGCPIARHKKFHRCDAIDPEKNLWHCNDCKRGGTIIDWVMIEKDASAAEAMRELGGGGNDQKERGQFVCAYDYSDERGELLSQSVRYKVPPPKKKYFSQRRPDGKGGWIWDLKGVRRVLYRLPEVIAASTVCVAEGEKDADNLAKLGLVATTNVGGAGKWRDEYSETLRGKDVVVFGDVGDPNETGENHTQQVIESLSSKAKSIKHVTLPDGFHDVSDYIASLPLERAVETIRKLIDKTPEVKAYSLGVTERESAELPPPPASYVPPPLDLLPPVLQEYVHAAAESLNVDVAFILLPLLSSLGTAIGNACSILLKPGFIQTAVIWTAIVGPSGSRKSPTIEAGCLPVMEHERDLMRQNKIDGELYNEKFSRWQCESKKKGKRPEKPAILTCICDDLTIEALADMLVTNPRGLLVRKDELSHWMDSFDQYRKGKGSDVARWLSLHTAVFLAVDRKNDNLHHRILQPRVCITGGIQPQILQRVLTPEFFERGLPARFLFAFPPFRKDKWSEETIADNLRDQVLKLFEALWLLSPKHDDHAEPQTKLLRLDADARAVFVEFYDECGESAMVSDEHGEYVWAKLTGYGARLALVGQLARDPKAETVTKAAMQAACELARWFGNEAVRIYAGLAETREQREQRELIEFIETRHDLVSVRDVTHGCWTYRNKADEAERVLNSLVRNGSGKWVEPKAGGRGQPTRKFHLLTHITITTNPPKYEGKSTNTGDGEAPNSQKNTPSREPDTEVETLVGDESGVARL